MGPSKCSLYQTTKNWRLIWQRILCCGIHHWPKTGSLRPPQVFLRLLLRCVATRGGLCPRTSSAQLEPKQQVRPPTRELHPWPSPAHIPALWLPVYPTAWDCIAQMIVSFLVNVDVPDSLTEPNSDGGEYTRNASATATYMRTTAIFPSNATSTLNLISQSSV